MCGCKIGRSMARSKKGGGITVTTEDVMYAVAGALGGLAINGIANKALESQSEGVRNTFGKALPILKVAGGAYVAQNKTMSRALRFAGLGVAGVGGIELGVKFAPNYLSINGTGSDVFALIGDTRVVNIPITPSASAGQDDAMFAEEPVAGTDPDFMIL